MHLVKKGPVIGEEIHRKAAWLYELHGSEPSKKVETGSPENMVCFTFFKKNVCCQDWLLYLLNSIASEKKSVLSLIA